MNDLKFDHYFGVAITLNTDGLAIYKHALTSSGLCVGALLKSDADGWKGLVQAPYLTRTVSDEFKTQEQAQTWITSEIAKQHAVQAADPDLEQYHFFKIRNGCRASEIIEILKVFEEFGANVGYLADADEYEGTSAMVFTAPRMALRFIPDAINPEIDSWGVRGRSYLCDKPEAIEAAMAAFPHDVTAEQDIYLPLSSLSDLRATKSSIAALHQSFLDRETEKKTPKL
ncbi:hypothetical protein [Rhizobium sp. MHM7A]|uniref:hypothetical protein n=1 Tax=Rhizobium sp. MHM7A TaxID=2583233 RepID=UPI001105D082|nr:hypothetical protein [Rhizobium sp. MHM7A]TLX16049.1 hypothetical protein FFR93_01645 [Rhizobium sp. MHM7A]